MVVLITQPTTRWKLRARPDRIQLPCVSPSSAPGMSTPATTPDRRVAHPDAELIAVWDDDPDRGAALAEQHGVGVRSATSPPCSARDDLDAVTDHHLDRRAPRGDRPGDRGRQARLHREAAGTHRRRGRGDPGRGPRRRRPGRGLASPALPRLHHRDHRGARRRHPRSAHVRAGPAVPRRAGPRLAAGAVLRPARPRSAAPSPISAATRSTSCSGSSAAPRPRSAPPTARSPAARSMIMRWSPSATTTAPSA